MLINLSAGPLQNTTVLLILFLAKMHVKTKVYIFKTKKEQNHNKNIVKKLNKTNQNA